MIGAVTPTFESITIDENSKNISFWLSAIGLDIDIKEDIQNSKERIKGKLTNITLEC